METVLGTEIQIQLQEDDDQEQEQEQEQETADITADLERARNCTPATITSAPWSDDSVFWEREKEEKEREDEGVLFESVDIGIQRTREEVEGMARVHQQQQQQQEEQEQEQEQELARQRKQIQQQQQQQQRKQQSWPEDNLVSEWEPSSDEEEEVEEEDEAEERSVANDTVEEEQVQEEEGEEDDDVEEVEKIGLNGNNNNDNTTAKASRNNSKNSKHQDSQSQSQALEEVTKTESDLALKAFVSEAIYGRQSHYTPPTRQSPNKVGTNHYFRDKRWDFFPELASPAGLRVATKPQKPSIADKYKRKTTDLYRGMFKGSVGDVLDSFKSLGGGSRKHERAHSSASTPIWFPNGAGAGDGGSKDWTEESRDLQSPQVDADPVPTLRYEPCLYSTFYDDSSMSDGMSVVEISDRQRRHHHHHDEHGHSEHDNDDDDDDDDFDYDRNGHEISIFIQDRTNEPQPEFTPKPQIPKPRDITAENKETESNTNKKTRKLSKQNSSSRLLRKSSSHTPMTSSISRQKQLAVPLSPYQKYGPAIWDSPKAHSHSHSHSPSFSLSTTTAPSSSTTSSTTSSASSTFSSNLEKLRAANYYNHNNKTNPNPNPNPTDPRTRKTKTKRSNKPPHARKPSTQTQSSTADTTADTTNTTTSPSPTTPDTLPYVHNTLFPPPPKSPLRSRSTNMKLSLDSHVLSPTPGEKDKDRAPSAASGHSGSGSGSGRKASQILEEARKRITESKADRRREELKARIKFVGPLNPTSFEKRDLWV